MKYRKMPGTGDMISVLGFGCMRFPSETNGAINEREARSMLAKGIEMGVNYIDTAWPYHGGRSEPFVGKALSGSRDRVRLATKLPSWLINKSDDMEYYIREQLKRLRTDHIDYYLVHALNSKYWKNLKENGLFSFLDRIKADGRVGSVGFSFHDEFEVFRDIVDAYEWTFCQIQYNFFDIEYQAGKAGLDYAAEKGMGIVVMEPLRGGKLVNNIPGDIDEKWNRLGGGSPAANALQWLWDQPEITTVLSGMSTMEQVEENIDTASGAYPGMLKQSDRNVFSLIRDEYLRRMAVDCTSCGYCMPCPNGVDIPSCFESYNEAAMFGDEKKARDMYGTIKGGKAGDCVSCGVCMDKCPQNINIIKELDLVRRLFETAEKKGWGMTEGHV